MLQKGGSPAGMDDTTYYVTAFAAQIFAVVLICLLFWVDRKNSKRERENGQHTPWYRRGLVVGGWMILLPVLGREIPALIVSLLVFHGSVRPDSFGFDQQLFHHSLSFFAWLAIYSEIGSVALFIYVVYLAITRYLRQGK